MPVRFFSGFYPLKREPLLTGSSGRSGWKPGVRYPVKSKEPQKNGIVSFASNGSVLLRLPVASIFREPARERRTFYLYSCQLLI